MKSPAHSKSSGGFTLLEMVLGLTILAMISGTVYSIISTSVQSVSNSRVSQRENDQVTHFIRLCRQTFQSLPSTATLTIKTSDTSTGLQEVTISGSPEGFSFGTNPISYKDTILGLRPDTAATEASEDKQTVYNLSITREDIIPTDPGQNTAMVRTSGEGLLAPDDQGRVWMPLLSNVGTLTWRAYKNDDEQWVDEWDSTDLPLLIEMNLQLSGRSLPIRAVYTLPVLKLAGANKALAPKTPSTSLASNNAGGGGGGGNDRRGGGDRRGGDRGGDSRGKRGGPPGKGGGDGQRGGPPQGGGRPGGTQPGGAPKGGGTPAPAPAPSPGGGGFKR